MLVTTGVVMKRQPYMKKEIMVVLGTIHLAKSTMPIDFYLCNSSGVTHHGVIFKEEVFDRNKASEFMKLHPSVSEALKISPSKRPMLGIEAQNIIIQKIKMPYNEVIKQFGMDYQRLYFWYIKDLEKYEKPIKLKKLDGFNGEFSGPYGFIRKVTRAK